MTTAIRDWSAAYAWICAGVALVVTIFLEHLFLAVLVLGPAAIIATLAAIFAMFKGSSKWLLLTIPALAVPIYWWAVLFYECGRGNCF
ncbi:MAG: hypothetical protein KDD90_04965 [Sphingomonadaceae bacterium]|nr:hypothetical protein [Sphingomonadaceae bacterium]